MSRILSCPSEFSRETEPAGYVEVYKLRDWLKEVAHESVEVGRPDIQKLNSFFSGKPLFFFLPLSFFQITRRSSPTFQRESVLKVS